MLLTAKSWFTSVTVTAMNLIMNTVSNLKLQVWRFLVLARMTNLWKSSNWKTTHSSLVYHSTQNSHHVQHVHNHYSATSSERYLQEKNKFSDANVGLAISSAWPSIIGTHQPKKLHINGESPLMCSFFTYFQSLSEIISSYAILTAS